MNTRLTPGIARRRRNSARYSRVIGLQMLAGGGRQTLSAAGTAHASSWLFAGRIPEIRSRPADIVDIALEAGRFASMATASGQHRFFAADSVTCLPLMEGNGAEIARSETAPVVSMMENSTS